MVHQPHRHLLFVLLPVFTRPVDSTPPSPNVPPEHISTALEVLSWFTWLESQKHWKGPVFSAPTQRAADSAFPLECKETTFDFGTIWVTDYPLFGEFEITNTSSEKFSGEILAGFAGISFRNPTFEFQPGETKRILVGGMNSRKLNGPFEKHFTLREARGGIGATCGRCGYPAPGHAKFCDAHRNKLQEAIAVTGFGPLGVMYPRLGTWCLAAVFVLGIALALLQSAIGWHKRRPKREDRCPNCRYDLTGHRKGEVCFDGTKSTVQFSPIPRCPECGGPI